MQTYVYFALLLYVNFVKLINKIFKLKIMGHIKHVFCFKKFSSLQIILNLRAVNSTWLKTDGGSVFRHNNSLKFSSQKVKCRMLICLVKAVQCSGFAQVQKSVTAMQNCNTTANYNEEFQI